MIFVVRNFGNHVAVTSSRGMKMAGGSPPRDIVYLMDENGNYILDEDGNRIILEG